MIHGILDKLLCAIVGHEEEAYELLEPEYGEEGEYPAVMFCRCCGRERIVMVPKSLLIGRRMGPWDYV